MCGRYLGSDLLLQKGGIIIIVLREKELKALRHSMLQPYHFKLVRHGGKVPPTLTTPFAIAQALQLIPQLIASKEALGQCSTLNPCHLPLGLRNPGTDDVSGRPSAHSL